LDLQSAPPPHPSHPTTPTQLDVFPAASCPATPKKQRLLTSFQVHPAAHLPRRRPIWRCFLTVVALAFYSCIQLRLRQYGGRRERSLVKVIGLNNWTNEHCCCSGAQSARTNKVCIDAAAGIHLQIYKVLTVNSLAPGERISTRK